MKDLIQRAPLYKIKNCKDNIAESLITFLDPGFILTAGLSLNVLLQIAIHELIVILWFGHQYVLTVIFFKLFKRNIPQKIFTVSL